MFGFRDAKGEFIMQNHDIILAMLIPFSIRVMHAEGAEIRLKPIHLKTLENILRSQHESCSELVDETCSIMQKDRNAILIAAFLSIYKYLYLNETPEIYGKCMDFFLQDPETSLSRHLKFDIKVWMAPHQPGATDIFNTFSHISCAENHS